MKAKFKAIAMPMLMGLSLLTSNISMAQIPEGGKKISPELFGLFFEDINYAADGGLYAELVQNRSFEYNPTEQRDWNPFSFWEYMAPGFSIGRINLETNKPVHPNNPHYMVLEAEFIGNFEEFKGEAGVGLKNTGFDGMVIRSGEEYNFSLFARQLSVEPVELLVYLQNPQGDMLAKSSVTVNDNKWQQYTTSLTAKQASDTASLVVLVKNTGKLALDMVSLFPEKTFKNRANGLRPDLAQMLADLQPRFVRFPGGCLVHGDGVGNMYRWKNTIGPLEQRKGQRNLWGYHQTAGLGFYEYFQFCEDIGAEPIPIVPAGVSCQNSGGTWRIGGVGQQALCMDHMDDYVQDVLDLIEWANGPATSEWGAKRAAAGHSEPFNLKYLGIGNEDKMTPEFKERFTMIYETVKEKHPEIILIGTSGPFSDGDDFEKGWQLVSELGVPVVDEHYYKEPEWFIANHYRYDSYDREGAKVYLGEYASWGNKMHNALAEALYMTALERNGDVVVMASYAPLLAKKGFTQWTTDMVFFDNRNIVHTPNYHVQKMFMTNQGDYYFDDVISFESPDTLQAGSCVMDSRTSDVIIKLVNAGSEAHPMDMDLSRFKNLDFKAEKTVLSGDSDAENSFEHPRKVVPVTTEFNAKKKFSYDAPPGSVTVFRLGIIPN